MIWKLIFILNLSLPIPSPPPSPSHPPPSVPIGMATSLLLALLWLSPFLEQPTVPGDPVGVAVFALAAIIELTAEPLWVMGQIHQYVSLKVSGIYNIATKSDH